MNLLTEILMELDGLLDSKRKRHIAGGVLLSVSALFSGLAITVMTIKSEGELYE
ncbi:MAG: histidine kinase [Clostridiales bacterium]|nr:MAG: histidine kinase [Clostridiales bacterium]